MVTYILLSNISMSSKVMKNISKVFIHVVPHSLDSRETSYSTKPSFLQPHINVCAECLCKLMCSVSFSVTPTLQSLNLQCCPSVKGKFSDCPLTTTEEVSWRILKTSLSDFISIKFLGEFREFFFDYSLIHFVYIYLSMCQPANLTRTLTATNSTAR